MEISQEQAGKAIVVVLRRDRVWQFFIEQLLVYSTLAMPIASALQSRRKCMPFEQIHIGGWLIEVVREATHAF
ncbi:MAG: hypothetical protein H0W02_07860 [Ktedonobacteraceae bacterium]|nr:hypothetical protein [Ktedonobacteraceae bacterium]